MAHVLVVDDEAGVRTSLQMLLKAEFEVSTAGGVDEALRAIATQPPDLILLDLVMPGRNGLDLLAELQERGASVPVVVLTATATVKAAVKAMQLGAADFVTKPFELEALLIKVRQLVAHRALEQEVVRLRDAVQGRRQLDDMLGQSEAMGEVFRAIEQIAPANANVLITGESGTGKELAARAIHRLSPRADGPFVAVNCGAIAPNLVESELFGHEKGSFTGAERTRIGHFEAASGGTLLLDEIGEVEPNVQVKLLRVLQEQQIERVGATKPIDVDVRIVSATHRDLPSEIEKGTFRADLYYRINVVPIEMPPLRERRDDIAMLAESFLAEAARDTGRTLSLSPAARAALERHGWRGNVRELQNVILRAHTLCAGNTIELDDLPHEVASPTLAAGLVDDQTKGRMGFDDAVAQFERELLVGALQRHGWNQTHAAEALQINRPKLRRKMEALGLEPPADRS